MKKYFIFLLVPLLLFSISAHADTTGNQFTFYYVFHLYQNSANQLVPDRDFKFVYDVIPGQFIQPPVGQFPYRGSIVNFQGAVAATFQFDARPGKLTIQAPYIADAQKAIFYDNQNHSVLTIPLSDSSYCNDDGICESDRGETYQTCSVDCKEPVLPAGSVSPTASASAASNGIWLGIVYMLIGLGLVAVGWWYMHRRKNNTPPPTYTPPQMPTPPTPNSNNLLP